MLTMPCWSLNETTTGPGVVPGGRMTTRVFEFQYCVAVAGVDPKRTVRPSKREGSEESEEKKRR